MVQDWKEDKDLVKFLRYLFHHDRQRFNIIKGKLPFNQQKEIMKVMKGWFYE